MGNFCALGDNMIQSILLIVIFTLYLSYTVVRDEKVSSSLSDTWYRHPNEFRWFMYSIGILIITLDSFVWFLSGFSLVLVGVAGWFREDKYIGRIHFGGAVSGILLAFLGAFLSYSQSYVFFFIWLSISLFWWMFKLPNFIWWVEVFAFIGVIIQLINFYFI